MKKLVFIIGTAFLVSCSFLQKATDPGPAPKNVILLIGDGMGLSQISYGILSEKRRINFERFKHIGFIKTSSGDSKITDSAAGATAFASGKKTYNGAIGVDMNKKPIKTILEIAEENGYSTGLIATSSITHATPAAFIAHQPDREMHREIAKDFLKTDIDVFIGGGLDYFLMKEEGVSPVDQLKQRGYCLVTTTSDLKKAACGKLAGLVAAKHLAKMQDGRGSFLSDAWEAAAGVLTKNQKGFFLMIEGSQIDWGGHNNDAEYIRQEVLDFDRVIGDVLDFAEVHGNTLVIVTADHETGGFALSAESEDDYKDIVPAFINKSHTATMVPVFAYGPGAEQFTGIYENTEIFDKMVKAFAFK